MGDRMILTGALRPWKRFVLMVSCVYEVDCGNWKQHAAIRDPIRARDDVGMLQPRNASLEKSQCGLAGGAGGAEGAEDGGELLRNLQPCLSSEAALRFLLSNFWSPALHFTQSIKTLITTLSPFLYVNPLKTHIFFIPDTYICLIGLFLDKKAIYSAGCNACYQPFTPPFPSSPHPSLQH